MGQNSSRAAEEKASTPFNIISSTPAFLTQGITERSQGSKVQKNDVEKQMIVVEFLKEVPNREPVNAQKIAAATQINLEVEPKLRDMLNKNPKVKIENGLYSYDSHYKILNKRQLVNLIDKEHVITWEDIRDSYTGIERDADDLIRTGAVICIENAETKQRVFFPRGRSFLTDISGEFEVRMNYPFVQPTDDAHLEVRRGDAVRLDKMWFRIPVGPVAIPNSVSSIRDVTKGNKPIENFTKEGGMPLDCLPPFDPPENPVPRQLDPLNPMAPVPEPTKKVKGVKYGCSNDIRALWEQTLQDMPKDDVDLKAALRKAGIKTGDAFGARRPKRFMKQQKKKRKRVSNREGKSTNTHLDGSEIGNAIYKAKQDGLF